ncbi:MAG: histidine kinase [Rubrivivax sp.]
MSTAFSTPHWQRFSASFVRGFHAYANWLVGITWGRYFLLSIALLVLVGILHDMPPFTWRITERYDRVVSPRLPSAPQAPRAATSPVPPEPESASVAGKGLHIEIDENGIRIGPAAQAAAEAGSAAARASRAASAAASAAKQGVTIDVPPGVAGEALKELLADVKRDVDAAIAEARRDADEAARDAAEASRDAQLAMADAAREVAGGHSETRSGTRTTRVGIGDVLMQFTLLWILGSGILKATYKGRVQAEVKAAQATETAEAESLKRQVVEARMAAMQAQVEPHFLFNTLASIDHLIETDPARASQMQKNLIALLRASMPTMREANDGGARDLGRELDVIRPYLEILKVRMEERLTTTIQVPDGLLSAQFPSMMIQTLVENAIKHGLEPKAEGGHLSVAAEIVHGKLQVTVADTGLGFGKAATAGTGVGLANIRERLQLLHGPKASVTVTENRPSGTVVTITVPYRTLHGGDA